MSFQISGLAPENFSRLAALSDVQLAQMGVERCVADDALGFPCRVSLSDAALGEQVFLLSYPHQPAHSPYQASGPIFVRAAAREQQIFIDRLPPAMAQAQRLFSLRAYDAADRIAEADVVGGLELQSLIEKFLMHQNISYLHVHFARYGCYLARVDRLR